MTAGSRVRVAVQVFELKQTESESAKPLTSEATIEFAYGPGV